MERGRERERERGWGSCRERVEEDLFGFLPRGSNGSGDDGDFFSFLAFVDALYRWFLHAACVCVCVCVCVRVCVCACVC